MRRNAERKPVASEGVNREQTHSSLMREMGSKNGAWNPEPEGHISGTLRPDVELSPNETRLIALVKSCCVGKLPRSAWGKIDGGKPLTAPRIQAFFGWESSAFFKIAKRPLAYGFIRVSESGFYGLGALVEGQFSERRTESEDSEDAEKNTVCTNRIPQYLFVQSKGLSPKEREKFIAGWSAREKAKKERIREVVAQARNEDQIERFEYCKSFGLDLKVGKKWRDQKALDSEVETRFVQTVPEPSSNGFVQTGKSTLYKVPERSVQTGPYIGVQRTENTEKTISEPESEIESEKRSEWVSEKPPLTHPLSEVANTLEQNGFPLSEADPLLAKFEALPAEHQIPERSVCRAIRDKISQKRAKGQRIDSAGALYGFVKSDMRHWIAQNNRALAEDAPRLVEAHDPEEHARWLRDMQGKLDDPELSDAEKKIVRRAMGQS